LRCPKYTRSSPWRAKRKQGKEIGAALFDSALANALGGVAAGTVPNIDWLSDSIKAMLTTSTYVPAKTTHEFKSSVTNEVSGTGYTATGVALTTKTLAITSSVIKADADDAVWTSATITARNVVVYDATPATDATRPLIYYHANATDVISTGGEFRVAWHANGIFQITISAEA